MLYPLTNSQSWLICDQGSAVSRFSVLYEYITHVVTYLEIETELLNVFDKCIVDEHLDIVGCRKI